jgi:hypothetical protein
MRAYASVGPVVEALDFGIREWLRENRLQLVAC